MFWTWFYKSFSNFDNEKQGIIIKIDKLPLAQMK